jgi:preprotein translocase subunit SecB
MSGGTLGAGNGDQNGLAAQGPRVQVVAQYVKDLSFENPGATSNAGNPNTRPQIDLGVDLQARQLEGDHFEVELKLRVSATSDGRSLFLLELVYAGLFLLQQIPDEVRQPFLLVEAPYLLFPFVRRIVADTIRDGGLPPMMIEPIDFAALYRAKAEEMQQMRAGAPSGVA